MATILGARFLLLVVILDCFLYFGMGAVGIYPGFGNDIGTFVNINGTVNSAEVGAQVNYSSGGTIVQASSMGYSSIGIDTIITFVGSIFSIMTAPMNMMILLGMPLFVQVLVGGTYIVLVLASVAQLISGRFA